jgi:hypothetical protein
LIELDKVVQKLLFKSRIWRTPRGGKVYLCPSPILLKDTFVQTGSHLLILSLGHAPSLLFGTMFHTIKVFNHRYWVLQKLETQKPGFMHNSALEAALDCCLHVVRVLALRSFYKQLGNKLSGNQHAYWMHLSASITIRKRFLLW